MAHLLEMSLKHNRPETCPCKFWGSWKRSCGIRRLPLRRCSRVWRWGVRQCGPWGCIPRRE